MGKPEGILNLTLEYSYQVEGCWHRRLDSDPEDNLFKYMNHLSRCSTSICHQQELDRKSRPCGTDKPCKAPRNHRCLCTRVIKLNIGMDQQGHSLSRPLQRRRDRAIKEGLPCFCTLPCDEALPPDAKWTAAQEYPGGSGRLVQGLLYASASNSHPFLCVFFKPRLSSPCAQHSFLRSKGGLDCLLGVPPLANLVTIPPISDDCDSMHQRNLSSLQQQKNATLASSSKLINLTNCFEPGMSFNKQKFLVVVLPVLNRATYRPSSLPDLVQLKTGADQQPIYFINFFVVNLCESITRDSLTPLGAIYESVMKCHFADMGPVKYTGSIPLIVACQTLIKHLYLSVREKNRLLPCYQLPDNGCKSSEGLPRL
ncbi:hypothetical protein VP01_508g3 [Puccinia sorghi]|uniref:Uncharacterized protein n=1 Tax=Puccinia sorghi TaxID=27349 RepID=A0A0L6ULB2_9BASI|nr:hypothetical protein VP01_508g3 [Puccinia sorghi]